MQRANLPLSYPMTARRFLEKHGLLDAQEYQRRLVQQGNPEAVSVAYPLSDITFRDGGAGHNLLVITVDGLNEPTMTKALPNLTRFGESNVRFSQHFTAGNTPDSGLFGLFYGISPSYMDGVLASRIPSALITSLSQQGYQFGLFASDSFRSPLYRRALLADFSLPVIGDQPNSQTTAQWQRWLGSLPSGHAPWFSWVSYSGLRDLPERGKERTQRYSRNAKEVDGEIGRAEHAGTERAAGEHRGGDYRPAGGGAERKR